MAAERTRILVVEDEPAIVELVTFSLRDAGWDVQAVSTVGAAWDAITQRVPDLVLLDWMLPDQSGLRLLGRIRADRQFARIPVIMLTAKSMEEDKISGLDAGADDYVTKPFSPRELLSRAKALLRRKAPEQGMDLLTAGPVQLDPAGITVTVAGTRVEIGQAEFKLLKYLMAHQDRAFTRAQLLDKVWGNHVAIEERTVDVHVLRLRKALGDAEHLVRTVRSVGYMLSEK
ncbi:MAG TPA: response regulator [Telluria sp.]|nr:response regulator [Telluria sp.]